MHCKINNGTFKNISFILVSLSFFLCFSIYAQNKNYYRYQPAYKLILPDYTTNRLKINPPFVTDSIFNWQCYQFPFPYTFTDIFFIDLLYGWATHTGYGVARTTDGGITWDTTSFGSSNYMGGVNFINRNTGWVVGIGGTIRKTVNGGVNWIVQDYEFPAVFRKVHFFDENTGFIVGEKNIGIGYVLKTTNSGVNWNEVFISAIYDTELLNQYWLNSNTGWACGSNILIKTTNSGLNFANFYSSIPPTQNGANWLSSIVFVNDSTGWIGAGNLDKKNIYKTTNGGLNWFFQDNPVTQYEYPQINDIEFISPYSGWAASLVGIILFTSNGGNNWVIDNTANSEFWSLCTFLKLEVWSGAYPGQIWSATIHEPSGILNQNEKLPTKFKLLQNYPNPFNSETVIRFEVPHLSHVQLKIYNLLGEDIQTLVDGQVKEGHHEINFNASNLSSGVYFYRLTAGSISLSKKFILLK